jgi:hypothetical protein
MFTLPTFIQHRTVIPSQSNKARERNEKMLMGREEVKLSLFADMFLYLKDPKDSLTKLPDVININVTGYKINAQNQ